MADSAYLLKREKLATLLFENWTEIKDYVDARRVADQVMKRICDESPSLRATE